MYSMLVPLVIILFQIEQMGFGVLVTQARKKHGIPYPTMYAVPGTKRYYDDAMREEKKKDPKTGEKKEDKKDEFDKYISDKEAYSFNLIQRGHQNMIENAPFFLALLLVAWPYPLFAGIAGLAYLIGRALYMYGYTRGPSSRMYGAAFIYPSLLTLIALSGMSVWNVVNGIGPH